MCPDAGIPQNDNAVPALPSLDYENHSSDELESAGLLAKSVGESKPRYNENQICARDSASNNHKHLNGVEQ
jgi:hypothetical protein